ncbi:hypothetical protein RF11_16489 [Thelohanellus kitauei]|uniref:Uncharacterized protein n=1 Tax=Thelohanellus kitauei TaxID=669202 RepID=A0A0C2J5V9_THEKT|nr:hypothetical protein RF11_16489 [Thelohanellus kitauei]
MLVVGLLVLLVANIGSTVGMKCVDSDYHSPKQEDIDFYLKVRDRLLDGSLQIPDPYSGKLRGVNDYETKLLKRGNKVKVKSQSSLSTHLMFEISPVRYWDLFTVLCWDKCLHATLYMEVKEVETPEPKIEVMYFRNRK